VSHRTNPENRKAKSNTIVQPLRCEPLLARINPMLKGRGMQSAKACEIGCAGSSSVLSLDPPFFTRLVADACLPMMLKRSLLSELESLGIAWLGDPRSADDNRPQDLLDASMNRNRIASIRLDQPIDVESLQSAAAIELQMFGVPFQTLPSSRRACWTPGFPVELSDFEQLAKKIELLRNLTGGKRPIGAAISPGAVYEDIRFMVDSGFDFITLLCHVQFGLSASNCLMLAPLESTVEQAVKAVQDSATQTRLLVSGNLLDGPQMFRCIQMGVSAISIDAFLVDNKPMEIVPPKETFGSVLRAYVPATSNTSFAWLQPAVKQLVEELNDCAVYAGNTSK